MKSMEQGSGDGCLQPCLFGLNRGYEFSRDFAYSMTSSVKLLINSVLGGVEGVNVPRKVSGTRGEGSSAQEHSCPMGP